MESSLDLRLLDEHIFEDDTRYIIDRNQITVVIPTLNEEKAIGSVLSEVQREGFENILVVDGYSRDNTVEEVEKFGIKPIQQEGGGKTGAIKTAINHVRTPYFIVIDGDSTYDPVDIELLAREAVKFNQVIGSRRDRVNIKPLNRFGNNMINLCFNVFFGTHLTDVCSGLYILRTNFAKTLVLNSRGFDVEVEIAAQAANSNSIKEVPIAYRTRIGVQKLNPLRDGFKIVKTILSLGRKYNPIIFYSFLASILLIVPGLFFLFWSHALVTSGFWSPQLDLYIGLFINTGIEFLFFGIIISQVKHLWRYVHINQLEKKMYLT
jgi:dolichol-phosphate mannosyltransferase